MPRLPDFSAGSRTKGLGPQPGPRSAPTSARCPRTRSCSPSPSSDAGSRRTPPAAWTTATGRPCSSSAAASTAARSTAAGPPWTRPPWTPGTWQSPPTTATPWPRSSPPGCATRTWPRSSPGSPPPARPGLHRLTRPAPRRAPRRTTRFAGRSTRLPRVGTVPRESATIQVAAGVTPVVRGYAGTRHHPSVIGGRVCTVPVRGGTSLSGVAMARYSFSPA